MSLTPDEIRKIAKEEARKENVNGFLSATIASASIDGHITLHDIVLATLIPCVFAFTSIFLAVGALLCGVSTRDTLGLAGRTIMLGGAFAGLRLLIDAINPLGMITEFREFRDWQQDYYPPPESAITIKLEMRDSNNGFRFLHLDTEQTKKAMEFAREYLSIAEREDYPTAEKFYVGSGKIFSRSETDYANWQAFKSLLFANRLAFEQGSRWHLTESGKRAMMKIEAANSPTPT